MNHQFAAVRCGCRTSTSTAMAGAYRTAASTASSQTKPAALTAEACLLHRFQTACATAATRIRATAVRLNHLLLPRSIGWSAYEREFWAGRNHDRAPGAARRGGKPGRCTLRADPGISPVGRRPGDGQGGGRLPGRPGRDRAADITPG